ncbi:MAG: ABC transporter ATP-binding protein [Actinobacteria bacterium]|nr:ABC transporter ATP-binding protein [Actinomycetota bacterium]
MSRPVLSVRNVRVSFGGLAALDDVSIDVVPGEVVGIIGPNGAGKSTLLNVVSGFVEPQSGEVRLEGREITGLLPYRRARLGIARSFQDARLFPAMTVRETLLGAFHERFTSGMFSEGLGAPLAREQEDAAQGAIDALLHLVDLHPYLDHRVSDLSFGTTRALEMAALAARRPRLLLLDEPASGLQQSEVAVMGDLIHRLRGGAATVVIDHDVPFVAALSDRLVAMDLGRVVAVGRPDEVLAAPAVIDSYLGGAAPVAAGGER